MIVLITGGSGFLGKHLIWAFLDRADVTTIRILDRVPLDRQFKVDCEKIKRIETIVGDIRDIECVKEATKDVTVVIHSASVVIMDFFDDETNFKGTVNVIDACKENCVPYVVYTGTTEMGRTCAPVLDQTEDDIDRRNMKGSNVVLYNYSLSKWNAEQYVLKANGTPLQTGHDSGQEKFLYTASIRPSAIYGEFDCRFVPQIVLKSKKFFGIMPILGSKDAKLSKVYAGNVAWAHLCAIDNMTNPLTASSVSGKSFIVGDDTPSENHFSFFRPVLEANDIKIIPFAIPLYILLLFVFLGEIVVFVLQSFMKIKLPVTRDELIVSCVSSHYNTQKIRTVLGYSPKFSHEEAMRRSNKFYTCKESMGKMMS